MRGTLLGNYRVLDKLGEGGMGEVYVGRHETLGHSVAVKVLQAEFSNSDEMVQRFFNEAQAATSIRNLGIVQVFDFGTTPDGRAYFAMELLEGQSLAARLKKRRLSYEECCRIGRQIANVLQAAHTRGITHRDLKPDNLFLISDPEVAGGERVKVLDFGIAKLAGEVQAAGVKTRTGLVMGTPTYMSPEQCRGAGAVDTRADIYSLGCILFKMACGRPPFVGDGSGEIVGAHLHVPPPHPQSLAPDIPSELAALISQMLAKLPDARPPTMTAVGQALDEILRLIEGAPVRPSVPLPVRDQTSVHAPQVSTTSTTLGGSAGMSNARVRPDRRRLALVLGGLIVASGIATLVVMLAVRGSDSSARQVSYNDIETRSPNATIATDTAVAMPPAPPTPVAINDLAPSADASIVIDAATSSLDASIAIVAAKSRPDASIVIIAAKPSPDASIAIATAKPVIDASNAMAADEIRPNAPLATVPPLSATEIEAKCRRQQTAKEWTALANCAEQLDQLNRTLAQEFKNRAVLEIQSASRIASIETLLQNHDLKRAQAGLDQVSVNSIGYQAIKRKYDIAENAAITDLMARLDRVRGAGCKEYDQLLTQERTANPSRVAIEAARQVKCTPPPKNCDADVLAQKGTTSFNQGALETALDFFEAAMGCQSRLDFTQKAFVTACNLRNLPKSRKYWNRMSPEMRLQVLGVCVRNGITVDQLNAL